MNLFVHWIVLPSPVLIHGLGAQTHWLTHFNLFFTMIMGVGFIAKHSATNTSKFHNAQEKHGTHDFQ